MSVSQHKALDWTPILVGWGQVVEREAGDASPMALAGQAAAMALADCGGSEVARAIDTICVTRLFSDTGKLWACKWGRSDNPPQSVAQHLGATPQHRIYTEVGGDQPQSHLIEFAADIANGDRDVVLLAGAEALKNQRYAEREQRTLDWNQSFAEPLDDRGVGPSVATTQELQNGLHNVAYYYSLIEQAQRHKAGHSIEQHRQSTARLLASLSAVAADNPYAQFNGQQTAENILAAAPMTHLYTKRMIAQDGVNQGAALLLCSIAKARALGIPESNWVYLHGLAKGQELEVSRRPDPARSPVAEQVADRALDIAGLSVDAVNTIDVYSCFPCAVTAVAGHLGLPLDGSRALTTTGGLPYFGGAGNNYSMHALAEAVRHARLNPQGFHMVTCNGGVLSKHAVGIYSCQPSNVDWSRVDTTVEIGEADARNICENPGEGTIASYTIHFDRDGSGHAIILADTHAGERFVAVTAKENIATPQQMLDKEPSGAKVSVDEPIDGRLEFTLLS
ncbi:MAG: hypothetical protein ACR2P1_20530 [Pseudomonadales bacterium]